MHTVVTRHDDVLISLGCDYITLTADEGDVPSPLHNRATSFFRHEADRGNKIFNWGVSGFRGFKCGGVEIGKKPGRVIVRLVSDVAEMHWRKLVQLSDNITRVDLQATIKSASSVTERIELCRETALQHASSNGDKPVVRWTADNRGGYTLYLGSRESNCFARVYDKYAHSGEQHHRECYRVEVQFQHKLAKAIAFCLERARSPKPLMAQYVSQFFEGRDMMLELPYRDGSNYVVHRSRSDFETNLKWLRDSVSPMVQRLIECGYGQEVLESLGLIQPDAESPGQSTSQPRPRRLP